jgi:hypothetical protein
VSNGGFSIHNVASQGINGRFWLHFDWDPWTFSFYPSAADWQKATPPCFNQIGAYRLTSFLVVYSNGSIMSDKNTDVSGTMKIGDNSLEQSLTLNGQPIYIKGSYRQKYASDGGGAASVTDSYGAHTLAFWTSNLELTTYSGIIRLNNGVTYEEWDHWSKVSDDSTSAAQRTECEECWAPFQWVGSLLLLSGATQ